MTTDLVPKSSKKFGCDFCDYYTSRKSQYGRHVATAKHLKMMKKQQNTTVLVPKVPDLICENCDKVYNDRAGLWRHKKKCTIPIIHELDEEIDKHTGMLTNLVMEVVKQNQETLKQNNELQKQIVDLCKNGNTNNTLINNNSHNKTFNLNMFLNEECKDAMNLTDFVDSLQLQLSDLEKIGELGYVGGLSNIIIRNLKALDVNKRPVHCSDAKRETIFIKEADKWEKENDENEKLNKAIKTVANKNIRMIPKWREKHPECAHSDSCKSDQYNNIIIQSLDTNPNSNHKIIANIAKEVRIKKDKS